MYSEKNIKDRIKRDLTLAAIVAVIIAIAYFLDWIDLINLP